MLTLRSDTPRRYLIDCAVTPGITIRAHGPSDFDAQSTSPSDPGMQIVSFYTPPLPTGAIITLRDATPNVVSTQSGPYYTGWRLTGCEITPVATPR
jgi:hypothetical protein